MNPTKVLEEARSHLGNVGGAFAKQWYADKVGDQTFAQSWVPWCAMFVSYVFDHAGQEVAGLPNASCLAIKAGAAKAARIISARDAEPGDIVIFNWHKDSVGCDHVGIIELNLGDTGVQTIEGNTSNAVNRRTRSWYDVQYVIRPIWAEPGDEVPPAQPAPSIPSGVIDPTESILAYDEYFGPLSTKYVQTALKRAGWYHRAIDGDFGYWTKWALQKYLRYNKGLYQRNCDGDFGYYSICALQRYLTNLGCYWKAGYGVCDIDGVWGPETTTAIQRAINAGVF